MQSFPTDVIELPIVTVLYVNLKCLFVVIYDAYVIVVRRTWYALLTKLEQILYDMLQLYLKCFSTE